jgi:hypothetical protein
MVRPVFDGLLCEVLSEILASGRCESYITAEPHFYTASTFAKHIPRKQTECVSSLYNEGYLTRSAATPPAAQVTPARPHGAAFRTLSRSAAGRITYGRYAGSRSGYVPEDNDPKE